jgi:mannose-6-phosphate isomerase-like protein (cupin superfamily)
MDIVNARVVHKPWGHERIFAHTDRYVGKILHITAGHLLSRQYHRVKDESLYVLDGVLILETGAGDTLQRRRVEAGGGFHVTPGTIHRFIAPEDSDCNLLEVSTPELDDVVRIEDVYGREGTSEP